MKQQPKPGDRVRFTATALRSMGMYTERMAPYTVLECHGGCGFCNRRTHVLVDDPVPTDGMYTAEELKAQPTLAWRHIAIGGLQKARF